MTEREFAGMYEKYLDKIYNFCFWRLGQNKELAEDITSETFLRALGRLPNYEERGTPFSSFLYHIAHNLIVDHYREQKPIELEEGFSVKEVPNEKVEISRIWEEIEKLPEKARTIMTLRYNDELPIAEIAEITEKTESNVRVIIHRTLKYLQQKYGKL